MKLHLFGASLYSQVFSSSFFFLSQGIQSQSEKNPEILDNVVCQQDPLLHNID